MARLVLHGACLDLAEGGIPYGPLTEALRGYLRDLSPQRVGEILGPARDEIGRLLPGIGDARSRGDRTAPTSADDAAGTDESLDTRSGLGQARLFGLLLQLIGDLATDTPVVMVFEDLHWVDRSTRDLVTFLARNLDRERLLLVLTVRTDDLGPGHPVATWLASLARDTRTTRLELARLDRADVARQVDRLLEGGADEALVARIHARSDGNPFFVEELVAAERRGGSERLPRTLAETLAGQIASLPDAAQRLLGIVAVAGRPVREELIAAVADRSEPEVREPIRAAVASGVLHPDPGTGTLRLRHALLGEVVEATAPAGRATRTARTVRGRAVRAGRPAATRPRSAPRRSPITGWAPIDRARRSRASIAAAEAAERVYANAAAAQHYAIAPGPRGPPRPRRNARRRDCPIPSSCAGEPPARPKMPATASGRSAGCARRSVVSTRRPSRRVAGILHSRLGYSLWVAGAGTRRHSRRIARRYGWSRPRRRAPRAPGSWVASGAGSWARAGTENRVAYAKRRSSARSPSGAGRRGSARPFQPRPGPGVAR